MIAFFGFLIRCCLAFILLVWCVVFLGPFMVQWVNDLKAQSEDYSSVSERFQGVERVRELLNEKGISEVGFDDLLGLLESKDSSAQSSSDELSRSQVQFDRLGLSAADLQELGAIYLELREAREATPSSIAVEPSVGNSTRPLDEVNSADGL